MLDPSLMIDAVPRIPAGLGLTLQLLLVSAVLGLLIAILLLLMRISGRRWLSWPSQVYIYVFRGTPILVQIFIIYHGLPQFDWIRDSVFWPVLREPYGCAVLALSLNTGAYVSEILRGGVLGVDRACWRQAARSVCPHHSALSSLPCPSVCAWPCLPMATMSSVC